VSGHQTSINVEDSLNHLVMGVYHKRDASIEDITYRGIIVIMSQEKYKIIDNIKRIKE
jgi:hypothetical protein